jgi:hypothetical protein
MILGSKECRKISIWAIFQERTAVVVRYLGGICHWGISVIYFQNGDLKAGKLHVG